MHKSIYTDQYQILLTILREFRHATGMTQGELAALLDMRQSDVSKCELGTRRLDMVEVKLWAEALGTTLGDVAQELDERVRSASVLARGRKVMPGARRKKD